MARPRTLGRRTRGRGRERGEVEEGGCGGEEVSWGRGRRGEMGEGVIGGREGGWVELGRE